MQAFLVRTIALTKPVSVLDLHTLVVEWLMVDQILNVQIFGYRNNKRINTMLYNKSNVMIKMTLNHNTACVKFMGRIMHMTDAQNTNRDRR